MEGYKMAKAAGKEERGKGQDKQQAIKRFSCTNRLPAGAGVSLYLLVLSQPALVHCSRFVTEYRIDGGAWEEPKAVIHLMQELLDLRCPCEVRQRFSFQLRCPPEKLHRLFFVMEQPGQFIVKVNGVQAAFASERPVFDARINFKDLSLYKTDILPLIHQGENTIELSCRFYQSQHVYDVLYGENVYETERNKLTYDTELESVYLLGDFGVYSLSQWTYGVRSSLTTDGPFVLDTLPDTLQPGDFTTQGLSFFSGVLQVEKDLRIPETDGRIVLALEEPRAGLTQAAVNGVEAKTFLWGPFTCDITNLVNSGRNTVTVR